jgi:hypothetical protein
VTRCVRARSVVAPCRIDRTALQASFEIETPVHYAEYYAGDRDEKDFPTGFIVCDAHTSMIHTLHPDGAGATVAPISPY